MLEVNRSFLPRESAMMKRVVLLLGVPAVLLAGIQEAKAGVLYSQASNFPVSGAVGLWASENDTTPFSQGGLGLFAQAFDDFTLASAGQVNQVTWQGGYFLPPQAGTITAFTLTFYNADPASGRPGTVVAMQTINGNGNETFVGTEIGSDDGSDNLIYNYSDNLIAPVSLAAGVTYWLSIVPDLVFEGDPSVGQWGWHTGTGGNGGALEDFEGTTSPTGNDLAFSLNSVPEPASITLCAIAGVISLGHHWRRRRATAG
jgi:hypothetical protein